MDNLVIAASQRVGFCAAASVVPQAPWGCTPLPRAVGTRRLVAAAFFFPGLILTGCAGGNMRPAAISLPRTFETAVASSVDADALDRWWKLFDDPQLVALLEQASVAAPDAKSALAVLDEARATRQQALSEYNPQGGLSASVTYQQSGIASTSASGSTTSATAIAGNTFTYSGGFSPSWELGLFGRRAALRSSADADLDTARFVYEASRQSLATNIAGNLFEARGLALQLAEARDTERIAKELAEIGRQRVAVGIGAEVDAASLDGDYATAVASREQLEAQLKVSKRTLLVLLGRGIDPLDDMVVEAHLGEPPSIPQTVPGALLARRPDVREAEARVRAAAGTLKIDKLALLPTFTLSPSATGTKVTGGSGYTTSLWSIAAALYMPILDRSRLLAEIRAEKARGEQVVVAYEKVVQTAYGEAESTITTYVADRTRLIQLARAEERSHHAFEAQRIGYGAGIVDLTTLLTAERTWRSARTQYSQLNATTLTDAVNVYRALGGGWSPSMVTANVSSLAQATR